MQHEGIFVFQSIQHHICFLYHDHNDEQLVYSLEFPNGLALKSLKTMCEWVLSIYGRIQRTCCLNQSDHLQLLISSEMEQYIFLELNSKVSLS